MSKNSLYATTSYPALEAAARSTESAGHVLAAGGPADAGPAVTNACCPGLADVQMQMQTLRDWVNKRLCVIAVNKYLYRTNEAKAALGCGTSKLYDLINDGTLDARKLGHRTYITAESLEAFVASLPPIVTPTLAKAERERWLERNNPRSGLQEDVAE